MKWSKLKQTVEEKFSDSIGERVKIYTTRYTSGSYFMVRGWITIDGIEIANFSTPENYAKYNWNTPELDKRIPQEERNKGNAVEKGEFSRHDLMDACWSYINLSMDEALKSDNPIISAFAMLDKRHGKRRLRTIDRTNLHPLAAKMLKLRLQCESLSITNADSTNIDNQNMNS